MVRVNVNRCSVGAYVRYYMNGWHYWNFNPFESEKQSNVKGTQVLERFSATSRIEQTTGKEVKTFYVFGAQSIKGEMFEGLKGLLYAEVTQLYYNGRWADMNVNRESFTIRQNSQNAYDVICKAELLNVGDIDTALVVPDFEDEDTALVILEDNFNLAAPTGWNVGISLGNNISETTIGTDTVWEVFLDADPLDAIGNSLLIMDKELTGYHQYYGTIKTTLEASAFYSSVDVTYREVSGYTEIYFDFQLNDDVTTVLYPAKKKTFTKTQVINQIKPLRYAQLRFTNASKTSVINSFALSAYLNYFKIEIL